VREAGRDAIRGKEAGNAVVLKHGSGWETQYSHLRLGSVQVAPGEQVAIGQVLGLIGLSGNTEFPHVHFEVRHRGQPVDPFVGLGRHEGCRLGEATLWSAKALKQLDYQPTGLLQWGFASDVPSRDMVANGTEPIDFLPRDAPAIVFWVELFGAQAGDEGSLTIASPDGTLLFDKDFKIRKHKARWFSYGGKKRKKNPWPAGKYTANYELRRKENNAYRAVVSLMRRINVR
jgi:hypothetical protein